MSTKTLWHHFKIAIFYIGSLKSFSDTALDHNKNTLKLKGLDECVDPKIIKQRTWGGEDKRTTADAVEPFSDNAN